MQADILTYSGAILFDEALGSCASALAAGAWFSFDTSDDTRFVVTTDAGGGDSDERLDVNLVVSVAFVCDVTTKSMLVSSTDSAGKIVVSTA